MKKVIFHGFGFAKNGPKSYGVCPALEVTGHLLDVISHFLLSLLEILSDSFLQILQSISSCVEVPEEALTDNFLICSLTNSTCRYQHHITVLILAVSVIVFWVTTMARRIFFCTEYFLIIATLHPAF